MQSNLSLGNLAWRAGESSLMPRTVRIVDGPSSLSGCKGTPQSEKKMDARCQIDAALR